MNLIHLFAENDMGHFVLLQKDGDWVLNWDLALAVQRDVEIIRKTYDTYTATYYMPKHGIHEKTYMIGNTVYIVDFTHLWVPGESQ
jgi:hypothetical protein